MNEDQDRKFKVSKNTTAIEFMEIMKDVADQYEIADFKNEVGQIVFGASQMISSGLSLNYITSDSYDMTSVVNGVFKSNNPNFKSAWCLHWDKLMRKYSYSEFCKIGMIMKHEFLLFRMNYLINQIAHKVTGDFIEKFGVCELMCEKALQDILNDDTEIGQDSTEFILQYESLYGGPEIVKVSPESTISAEHLEIKPKSYWLGTTAFDSMYMSPFFSVKDKKWIHIPVPLIQQLRVNHRMSGPNMWDGDDYDYD